MDLVSFTKRNCTLSYDHNLPLNAYLPCKNSLLKILSRAKIIRLLSFSPNMKLNQIHLWYTFDFDGIFFNFYHRQVTTKFDQNKILFKRKWLRDDELFEERTLESTASNCQVISSFVSQLEHETGRNSSQKTKKIKIQEYRMAIKSPSSQLHSSNLGHLWKVLQLIFRQLHHNEHMLP